MSRNPQESLTRAPRVITVPDMPPTTSNWRMADRLADGKLADQITVLRGDGNTWEQIAKVLFAEHGIEVTGQTLRLWGAELGIADKAVPA